MPTIGVGAGHYGLADEVATIQKTITQIIDGVDGASQDVILVCHSYGGWPGSRAVQGLDKVSRQSQGKQHGIIRLFFMSAFLLPEGASGLVDALPEIPAWTTNEGPVNVPNKLAKEAFFSDLPPAAQEIWFDRLRPQSSSPLTTPWHWAPWNLSIPKTYLFLKKDYALPPASQETMFKKVHAVAENTWNTLSLDSGHDAFLSRLEEVIKILTSPPVLQG
ncbi:MAG: hypothetical protein M1831_001326 [Alyxoria varia]|nr:MAG: hypothetical protein M1831_001326 [Alyxoria varia]